jgi:hypothetical protein
MASSYQQMDGYYTAGTCLVADARSLSLVTDTPDCPEFTLFQTQGYGHHSDGARV